MSMKRLIAFIGIMFLVSSCSTDKYGNTFFGFKQPSTMTEMGVQYSLGRGVPKDDEKALYYFQQGAAQGDALAENKLGYIYAAGIGTPKDNQKAFMYYERAAKQGLASAQYSLGLCYLRGIGTPVNKAKATEWFTVSAKAGFEPAVVALKRYHS